MDRIGPRHLEVSSPRAEDGGNRRQRRDVAVTQTAGTSVAIAVASELS
jgi:hypothetical protein